MADITLSEELVQQLRKLAIEEGRPVDEVVRSMLEQYHPAIADHPALEATEEANSPLLGLIGLLDKYTDATDLSSSIRETLKENTHPQYGWTKRGRTD
jgi:hypothetical protein